MMEQAKAYAPANISCIFRIIENKNPAKKHSLGVGFTTREGVVVTVTNSVKDMIIFNNKKITMPTVKTVINRLTDEKVTVKIKSSLPFGCGFGLSGASALATAYAVAKLFNLKKSKNELAMIAHISEVVNGTGLGDVSGQYNGGVMAKLVKGHPLTVKNLAVKEKKVYYKVFSSLSTKSVISNPEAKKRINKAGDVALNKIKKLKRPTLNNITDISREFAQKSNLMKNKKVKSLVEKLTKQGKSSTMIMLGNAVYSDKPFKGCKTAHITSKGAHLL